MSFFDFDGDVAQRGKRCFSCYKTRHFRDTVVAANDDFWWRGTESSTRNKFQKFFIFFQKTFRES